MKAKHVQSHTGLSQKVDSLTSVPEKGYETLLFKMNMSSLCIASSDFCLWLIVTRSRLSERWPYA